MRYVHWLKIDGYSGPEETALQFQSIENYLKAYPKSKAMLYQYNSGSFNWVVRLECDQCYNDLDLDANSSTTLLTRISSKPKNIGRERAFEFPDRYKKCIE